LRCLPARGVYFQNGPVVGHTEDAPVGSLMRKTNTGSTRVNPTE
jgi:hypothetical protein